MHEFGTVNRFEGAQQGSNADMLTDTGWLLTPSVLLDVGPSSCLVEGDCARIGRASPNGMIDAAHALGVGTFDFAVAWAGGGCELLVEASSADTQRFSGAQLVRGGALPVTTGTMTASAGARVVLRTASSMTCFVAYVLVRGSAMPRPPPAPAPPPLAPPAHGAVMYLVAPACVSTDCTTLADALELAQTVSRAVTIELADGTYDTADLASWPFDMGRLNAPLELRAAPGTIPTLDAGGVTSIFILSLPSNSLTLRGLVLRNASAARWPHDGAAILVTAGQLHIDHCRFEANRAPGSGGAVALSDGVLRATGTVFDENEADGSGGALAVLEVASPDASASLTNCSFIRNRASFGGSAWLMAGVSRFTSCQFAEEVATANGGALQVAGSASFGVYGGSFTNNMAGGHGSAIDFDPTSIDSTADLGGAVFVNNTGLSTVKAAQYADWRCRPGEYAPRIGAFTGSWEGCPERCGPGTHAVGNGCEKCSPGEFQPEESAVSCLPCTRGSFCRLGSSAALPCAAGYWGNATNLGAPSECRPCPAGHICATASVVPVACSPGSVALTERSRDCVSCAAGMYQPSAGQPACLACPAGSACTKGATSPVSCNAGSIAAVGGAGSCSPCPRGTHQNASAASSCLKCSPGSVCPTGSAMELAPTCSAGTYADPLDESGAPECFPCRQGYQCLGSGTAPVPCPKGAYSKNGSNYCTDCQATLTHATTLNRASGSEAACCCDEGFYYDGNTHECMTCDEETSDCSVPGVTLHTLPLLPGFWRVADWSVELRRCPFSGCAGTDRYLNEYPA